MTAAVAPLTPLETILDAAESGTPLRIAGRGHWMDAGRPSQATRILSLADQSGVVDYVPGDLTITVRGGTTLDELQRITRAEGQWFPLDPFGSGDGTIGATIATGSFGPLAHGFGRARDLVLGIEFVSGEGKIVRGGGRVVKNVAGFDLVRLLTGSWGTLGVITEATLRLYSVPSEPVTIALNLPDGAAGIAQRVGAMLSGSIAPFAVEMIDAAMASHIGLASRAQVLVRVGGNFAAMATQREFLSSMGGAHEIEDGVWTRLRVAEDSSPEQASPIVIRLSTPPGRTAELWTKAQRAAASVSGAMMHATPSLGIVRCILPGTITAAVVESFVLSAESSSTVYERLPSSLWETLSPSVTSDRISQRVKRAFDPDNILNPGILGPLA
ncbi:MAG: FAD-binding protein [Gemmatimonadales bacterium]